MARVPVVTSPCPLRWKSMPSAGMDFCGQCSRRVHNLDGMSDTARAAFFATCSGEVCVAYSVRRPAALLGAIGLGVASMLQPSAVAAQDTKPLSALGADAATALDSVPLITTGPTCDPNAKPGGLDTIVVGGIRAARDVAWVDEHEAARAVQSIGEIDAAEWLPMPDTGASR
jgi:hypothetical protein